MNKALLALLCVGAVIAIGVSLSSSSDSKSSTSSTTTTSSYSNKSSYSSNGSSVSNSGGSYSGGGNRSSYWYDSPSVRKKKADDTLMKYYEYDENGNLTKKEGTIVNGKPYHKTK